VCGDSVRSRRARGDAFGGRRAGPTDAGCGRGQTSPSFTGSDGTPENCYTAIDGYLEARLVGTDADADAGEELSSRAEFRNPPGQRGGSVIRSLVRKLRLAMLGRTVFQRAFNLGMIAGLTLQRRLLPALEISFPFYVHRFGTTTRLSLGHGSDESVLSEVFLEEQYSVSHTDAVRVIVDLGGNVGFSAVYFAMRFPQARIFTLEPDPAAFRSLLKNTEAFPGIRSFPLAAAAENGTLTLHSSTGSTMSSSVYRRAQHAESHRVEAITLDEFLSLEGIDAVDILKIDIEGAEFDVLRSARSLDRVRFVIGEVHEDLMDATWEEFRGLLHGFELVDRPSAPRRRLIHGARRAGS
jgi:FkbM family methyltransferase